MVVRAGAGGERDRGEQPGFGFEGGVGFVALLVAGAVFVDVAGFGVDGGDGAVRDGALGDAPAPVTPVGVGRGLDVLAGDQGEQAERVGGPGSVLSFGQRGQEPDHIGDQGIDEIGAGLGVVPRDLRFARVGVVVGVAHGCDRVGGAGHLARDPPDR